jgi:hypothetical protein
MAISHQRALLVAIAKDTNAEIRNQRIAVFQNLNQLSITF